MLYVIGDPLFPDIELSPGEGLKRVDGYEKLRGIGTTYAYLSFGVSFSVMHGEDAKFRSINLLRSGERKFWLVVEPVYEKELERHMSQEFSEMENCSQALRHLSRVITPRKLDEWKIPYSLDYCVPGEAIVTEPGAFHQVLNMGSNYAIAINI
ncbi:JmjC domain, hydroxylase-domain-containing protein, partial [Bisporella sp. PMI_857]